MSHSSSPGLACTAYCGLCGELRWHGETTTGTSDGGGAPPSDAHQQCGERLQLEPPRHCLSCGRRLKVQVSPLGWRASCSRHGVTTS